MFGRLKMKDIKTYKHRKIQALITVIVFGIMLFIHMMRSTKPSGSPVIFPALVVWLVIYIGYVELKIKVEILEELKKEKANKSDKKN